MSLPKGSWSERSRLYRKVHGKPARVFGREDGVGVEAFAFDTGFVLFTNGMSERAMHLDEPAQRAFANADIARRAELVWYVRDLDPEYVANLRWLAELPFIDDVWLGFGHTIPMPAPIFDDSALTTYLLLTPIVRSHAQLFERLRVDGDAVELFAVHLLLPAEHALKRARGVNALLDLLDAASYPLLFDRHRAPLIT